MTKKIDRTEKEFIVDTGSLVTIMQPHKEIIKDKKKLLVTRTYQVVIKNEDKFNGKITVEAES